MSDPAKYREINGALVRALPELKARYDEETAAWGEEMGPHVIYGDVLNPVLSELLSRDYDPGEDVEMLRRIFNFLEELLAHPDPEYAEVARTTVAEHLDGHPDLLARARRFMGPLMAKATRDPGRPRPRRRLREN